MAHLARHQPLEHLFTISRTELEARVRTGSKRVNHARSDNREKRIPRFPHPKERS